MNVIGDIQHLDIHSRLHIKWLQLLSPTLRLIAFVFVLTVKSKTSILLVKFALRRLNGERISFSSFLYLPCPSKYDLEIQ